MTRGANEPRGTAPPEGAGLPGRPSGSTPSAQDLERFWELSLAMMGVRDYDGYVTLANPACTEVLGWSQDELRSVPYWEFVHPDDQHAVVESGDDLLLKEGGSSFGCEVRMLCRDGGYRWIRWNIRSIHREQLLYAIGVAVTHSGHVEERVRVGTWNWHIPSGAIAWSEELADMFGLPIGHAIGYGTFLDCVHAADRSMVDRHMRWSAASGEPYAVDCRIVQPDGSIRWVHSAGRVSMSEHHDPTGICGITRDVTERRKQKPGHGW